MLDLETELKTLSPEQGFRLYAERLQLWRLCAARACRRAQACRGDKVRCCRRFADWAEAVKSVALAERAANDPAAQALRSELSMRLSRLAASMRDEQ